MLPEVVLFSETEDTLRSDADLFVPDIESLIVILVDGGIETVRIQAYDLSQELPAPCDGFMFEIIAEGEVTQHLKEGAVTGSLTYVLNIARTDTFLTGGHSASRRDLSSCEVGFERSHS